MQIHIADLDIFYPMTRNTGDDRTELRQRTGTHNITDEDALQTPGGRSFRTPHARTEPQKQRRVADVAHGDIAKRDVLDDCAVHSLKREAAAAFEDAVRDRDVLEAAVRLGAEFDASGGVLEIVSDWL